VARIHYDVGFAKSVSKDRQVSLPENIPIEIKPMNKSLMLLTVGAFSFFMGCGGTNQQPLSGTVNWQGKPIERGAINFFPKSSDGMTVGSGIKDGKFSIDREYGPPPGKYRVEILAFRETGKTEFDVDQNKPVAIDEQYLPKQFNQSSTLETEIQAGKPNDLTFDLKP
jgi:hypothetical protein